MGPISRWHGRRLRRRLLAIVALTAVAYAATVTVNPASAVDCTASSTAQLTTHLADANCDRVIVEAGAYTGPFTISRPVEVIGPNAGIAGDGARGAEAVINSAGDGFVIQVQPDDAVRIDGLEFDVTGVAVDNEIDPAVAAANASPPAGPSTSPGQMETDMVVTIVNNVVAAGEEGVGLIDGASLTVADNAFDTTEDAVRARELRGLPGDSNCELVSGSQNFDGVLVITGPGPNGVAGDADDDTVCVLPTRGEVTVIGNAIDADEDGVEAFQTGRVRVNGNDLATMEDGVHVRDVLGIGHEFNQNTISSAGDEAIFLEDLKGTSNLGNPTAGDPAQAGIAAMAIDSPVTVAGNTIEVTGAVGDDTDTDRPGGGSDEENAACSEPGGSDGILLCDTKANPLSVENNRVNDPEHDAVGLSDVFGLDLRITGNTLSGGDDAVFLFDVAGPFVGGTTTVDTPGGIPEQDISGVISIADNRVNATGTGSEDGGECGGASEDANSNAFTLCDSKASPPRLTGNVVAGSADHGMLLYDVKERPELSRNEVTGATENAIELRDVRRALIDANLLSGQGPAGINLETADGARVTNNLINGFTDGVLVGLEAGGDLEDGSKGVDVTGNAISGAGRAGVNLGQVYGDATVAGNTLSDNPGSGVLVRDFVKTDTTDQGVPVQDSHALAIRSNNVVSNGTGIRLAPEVDLGAVGGSVGVHFNRIFRNAGGGLVHAGAGSVDGVNNWFGCNAGPGGAGCDTASGPVATNPWLVLGVGGQPAQIDIGGETSLITATLRVNSAGTNVGPGFPDGIAVEMTSSLGTLTADGAAAAGAGRAAGAGDNRVRDRTSAGEAHATLTSDLNENVAQLTAAMDNGLATGQVEFVCPNVITRARGKRLGRTKLGRKRSPQRRLLEGPLLRSRGGMDAYCARRAGKLRVGYPTRKLMRRLPRPIKRKVRNRVVLALTSTTRASVRGIRPGQTGKSAARRLRALDRDAFRRQRVRKNTWLVLPQKRVTILVKLQRDRVDEIGIADSRLTPRRRLGLRRFLTAWRLN